MTPRCLLLLSLAASLACAGSGLELVSVKKIWDQAPHCAFGDIISYRGNWYAVFREGLGHAPRVGQEDDGKLRVLVSKDGESWESAALVTEPGIDLRDPHLSITADGRLMIVAGGSQYPQGRYTGRQPRVAFSSDGRTWSAPQKVLEQGHWLWRVTWYKGRAYGISKYGSPSREMPGDPRRQDLVTSKDGVNWEVVQELKVPGGDETAVRFLPDGRMVALMRISAGDGLAMIGVSSPPYKEWQWTRTRNFIGGPNFIVLPNGRMIGGGRYLPGGYGKAQTGLANMTLKSYEPALILPSGGDSSYPGFAWHQNMLWTLYYSSHEGRTSIYLAKIKVH
ncbi:MAG: sialidase family protein [Bryobacteraceae bacterium]